MYPNITSCLSRKTLNRVKRGDYIEILILKKIMKEIYIYIILITTKLYIRVFFIFAI